MAAWPYDAIAPAPEQIVRPFATPDDDFHVICLCYTEGHRHGHNQAPRATPLHTEVSRLVYQWQENSVAQPHERADANATPCERQTSSRASRRGRGDRRRGRSSG